MWREIFKPLFRRLCAAAHERGLHVLMHSCGNVRDILGDLAEVGVNCMQFDQPALYGLEPLAARLQGLRSSASSRRWTSSRCCRAATGRGSSPRRGAWRELFSGRRGGFIAKNYSDLKGIGVQPEWDRWAYESVHRMRRRENREGLTGRPIRHSFGIRIGARHAGQRPLLPANSRFALRSWPQEQTDRDRVLRRDPHGLARRAG